LAVVRREHIETSYQQSDEMQSCSSVDIATRSAVKSINHWSSSCVEQTQTDRRRNTPARHTLSCFISFHCRIRTLLISTV